MNLNTARDLVCLARSYRRVPLPPYPSHLFVVRDDLPDLIRNIIVQMIEEGAFDGDADNTRLLALARTILLTGLKTHTVADVETLLAGEEREQRCPNVLDGDPR